MTHVRLNRKLRRFSLQVEFALAPGVTMLAGASGAGKSFILDAIAGFERPDAGRVLVEDAIVFDGDTGVNLAPGRRQVGYVGQADGLFPHMSVRQNLMFAAQHWARLERHKRVAEMADHFEMAAAMESKPADLTAAQRLACAVARALLAEPRLLLIDERGVEETLTTRIREAFGGPLLLVSGDFEFGYAAADGLILLDAGRVVQRGAAREVMENPESVEAARLLGIANIFPAEIAGLDPGRNTSLLHCAAFELSGPYLPGHFKGDHVTVAIRAEDIRVHSGELEAGVNFVEVKLARVSERSRRVRLQFDGGLVAEVSREQWQKQRDNRGWRVELPACALRVF